MRMDRWRFGVMAFGLATGAATLLNASACSGRYSARESIGEARQATQINGWGYYCSAVNKSTDGWSLWTGDLDFNPCSQEAASGEQTRSAGIFSATGPNTVEVHCDPNYYWIYQGWGQDPINWAISAASAPPHPGGCVFTVTPAPNWDLPPTLQGPSATGCANGVVAQDFGNDGAHRLVGCAGSKTWDQRASLCAYGWGVASATQWQAVHGSVAPTHNYWTDDTLGYANVGSGCYASSQIDQSTVLYCGDNQPMHVCVPSGTDPEGNGCMMTGCGLNSASPPAPTDYFGGCTATAGTLCTQDLPFPSSPSTSSSLVFDVNKFGTDLSNSLAGLLDKSVAMGYQLAIDDNTASPVWSTGSHYAGYDSSGTWQAMLDDRRFDVASMSKTITAAAVMAALEDLQARGAGITLDSSIAPYLPAAWHPEASVSNITFRDVLLHTAGLAENSGGVTDPWAPFPGGSPQNLYQAVKIDIGNGPCTTVPCQTTGQKRLGVPRYSNEGYAMLRIVLAYLVDCPAGSGNPTCVYAPYEGDDAAMADLTAQSYRNYIKNRLLDPIGLSDVDVNWAPGPFSPTPSQYVAAQSTPPASVIEDTSPAGLLHQEETAGPGCWNISALEYGKFVSSLRLGSILSNASYAKMAADEHLSDVRIGMYSSKTLMGMALSHNGGGGSANGPGVGAQWITFPNGYTATFIVNTYVAAAPALDALFNNALHYPGPPPPPATPSGWVSAAGGAATAIASGWAVSTNPVGSDYLIYYWDPVGGVWAQVSGAGTFISTDLTGTPWIVNSAGQISKWDAGGATWQAFPGGGVTFCATQVASGSNDTETWALHCGDNTIWHWNGSQWANVPGTATKIAVFSTPDSTCGDHLPVVLDTAGTSGGYYINFYRHSGCASGGFSYSNGVGNELTTDFAIGTDGQIYQWNQAGSYWVSWANAPWGTNTKMGAWSQGFFAIDANSHSIEMIPQQ